MTETPPRPRLLWLLVLLLLLAAAARLVILPREGLWLHEAYSMHLALQSPAQIIAETRFDHHPPLYALLLHYWLALFGKTVLVARLFSIATSLVATWLALRIARDIAGRRGLMVAGVLFALSPFWVYYSQEIRPYSLLGLWAMLATWGLWRMCLGMRVVKPSPRAGLVFTVGSLAGLYTGYVAGLILLAHLSAWLWLCHGHRRWLRVGLLVVVLAFLPWLPMLWAQLAHLPDVIAVDRTPLKLLATPIVWLGGYTQMLRPLLAPSTTSGGLVIATVIVLLTMLVIMTCSLCQVCSGKIQKTPLPKLLLITIAVPPVLLWLISLARPMYVPYVLLPSALSMLLLFGAVLGQLPRLRMIVGTGLCCTLFIVSLAAFWLSPNYGRGRTMDQLARHLQQITRPGDLVIFQDEALYLPIRVYGELWRQPMQYKPVLATPPHLAAASGIWPQVAGAADLARLARSAKRIIRVAREEDPFPPPQRAKPPLNEGIIAGSAQNPTVKIATYPPTAFVPEARHVH